VRESLLIGGWVAMWRPMEVFLYDRLPIRADARLADRLSAMPVRISYKTDTSSDARRSDLASCSALSETDRHNRTAVPSEHIAAERRRSREVADTVTI